MEYKIAKQLNDINQCSSKEEVASVFSKFVQFHRNAFMIANDSYLFRSRLEDRPFEVNDRQELSYIKNPDFVKMGRANLPNNPTFYGSTNQTKSRINQDYAMQTAIMEGSKKRREDNNEDFIEHGYISRWMTTKELKVFTFLNFDFGVNVHPDIIKFKQDSIDNIKRLSPTPERDIEINHWIASIFAYDFKNNDDCAYHISSMLANHMLQTHDGILYPSVQTNGYAVNIAIKKEAADTLKLEMAHEIQTYRKDNVTGVKWGKQLHQLLETTANTAS